MEGASMGLGFGGLFVPGREFNVNYDWLDLSSTLGFVSFDGFASFDSTGVKYHLIRSTDRTSVFSVTSYVDSTTISLTNTASASSDYTTLTKALDLDFDSLSFQLPATIKGLCYVNGHFSFEGVDSGNIALYVIARLRKWDGTTETELESVQSSTGTFSNSTAGASGEVPFSVTMDVSPSVTFKVGETLRLTIELWADSSADTTTQVNLAHDPQNAAESSAAFTAGNTRLICVVPFKTIL